MTTWSPDSNGRSAGSMPDDASNGTKQKIKEDARDVKREAGARAREQAEAGQHRIADEADTLSDAIDAAASSLDDDDREGLARYARELSGRLAHAAEELEGRSIDQLANDAKRLARKNPAQFMLGSIAVGFGLSRFFKASAERDHEDANAPRTQSSRPDEASQADDASPDDAFWSATPEQPRDRDMAQSSTTSSSPSNGDGRNRL